MSNEEKIKKLMKQIATLFNVDEQSLNTLSLNEIKNTIKPLSAEDKYFLNVSVNWIDESDVSVDEYESFFEKIAFCCYYAEITDDLLSNYNSFFDLVENAIKKYSLDKIVLNDNYNDLTDYDRIFLTDYLMIDSLSYNNDFYEKLSKKGLIALLESKKRIVLLETAFDEYDVKVTDISRDLILYYIEQSDTPMPENIALQIFNDKELFNSINDSSSYRKIFNSLSLDNKEKMLEYMALNYDKKNFSEFFSNYKTYKLDELMYMKVEREPLTEIKYKKIYLENPSLFDLKHEEKYMRIFSMCLNGNIKIDLDYSKLFNYFEKKLCAINSFYQKNCGSIWTSKNDNVFSCLNDIMKIYLENDDIWEKTSEEDILSFISNTVYASINDFNYKQIINTTKSFLIKMSEKHKDFIENLYKYKNERLDITRPLVSKTEMISIPHLIGNLFQIENNKEQLISILSCDYTLYNKYKEVITPEIIKNIPKLPIISYDKLNRDIFLMMLKYRINDLNWNAVDIYITCYSIVSEKIDELKEAIFNLKDDYAFTLLVKNIKVLGAEEKFVKRAININPSIIFFVDKKFQTMELAETLKFDSEYFTGDGLEKNIDFSCELINSKIIRIDYKSKYTHSIIPFFNRESVYKNLF